MDTSHFNTEEVLGLLKLQSIAPDRYLGQSHFMGSPNVFGGQVASQALSAAIATVEHRRPHSLHAMFILPGNHRLPIEYEVERVRDGGSFSVRRVVAIQEGKRIFVAMVSFQQPEEGLSHQQAMTSRIDPETLPSVLENRNEHATLLSLQFHPVPVDFRMEPDTDDDTVKKVWVRAPIALSDDIAQHETLFAYVSDYGLLPTSLQPHKAQVRMGEGKLQMASLDHTIWFHRPFRMDEWLLFSMQTPNASGGRGLSFAHVYNRQGVLVASLAQEGLIRMRERRSQ